MMKSVFAALTAIALSACADPNTQLIATKATVPTEADLAIVQAAVGEGLKDPGSMQVRSLKAYTASAENRILCGEYNAKNSFGAYTGFTPFYVRTRSGVVVSSVAYGSNDRLLNETVAKSCADAASGSVKVNPNA